MKNGIVNWFDDINGCGFITPDDGDRDIYVHRPDAETTSEIYSFEVGQKVEYDLVDDGVIPFAIRVSVI